MGAPTNKSENAAVFYGHNAGDGVYVDLLDSTPVDADDLSKGYSARKYWVSPVRNDALTSGRQHLRVGDVIVAAEGPHKITAVQTGGIGEVVDCIPCSLRRVRRKADGTVQNVMKVSAYEVGAVYLTSAEVTALTG